MTIPSAPAAAGALSCAAWRPRTGPPQLSRAAQGARRLASGGHAGSAGGVPPEAMTFAINCAFTKHYEKHDSRHCVKARRDHYFFRQQANYIASHELRPKSRGRIFLLPLYRGKTDFMTNYW
jgi:hypothetical protein